MVRQAHHEAHPGVSRVGAVSGWKPTGCLVLSLSKDEARPKRTQGNGLTVTGFWRTAQFDTLRLRLLKIAARVVELKTRLRVQLPTACSVQPILALVLARTARLVT
jgi:hypothetical protein